MRLVDVKQFIVRNPMTTATVLLSVAWAVALPLLLPYRGWHVVVGLVVLAAPILGWMSAGALAYIYIIVAAAIHLLLHPKDLLVAIVNAIGYIIIFALIGFILYAFSVSIV